MNEPADGSPADVAVVGLGVNGAAAALEFARRGLRVVALDMHEPPHTYGSSVGRARIIREAYFEHPLYVPLVQRARELWSEMEELTGAVLYRRAGGVSVGPPDGELVRGALASAREHGLEHELLDAATLRARFPALLPRPDHVAVLEPHAGVLVADACVRTMLSLARGHGAELRTGTRLETWSMEGDDVVIHTSTGTLRARRMVIAAGAWLNDVLARETSHGSAAARPLRLPLAVERQVPHLFAPAPGSNAFGIGACPVTLLEYEPGRLLYTLPDTGQGLKAGIHHEGVSADPDSPDRTVGLEEEMRLRALVDAWLPGAADRVLDAEVCLYTNTPDGHFIVDVHPSHGNVLLLSACSGHGFKFAPATAELAADLMLEGGSWIDVSLFGVARFRAR